MKSHENGKRRVICFFVIPGRIRVYGLDGLGGTIRMACRFSSWYCVLSRYVVVGFVCWCFSRFVHSVYDTLD